jgi:hypothetical protein
MTLTGGSIGLQIGGQAPTSFSSSCSAAVSSRWSAISSSSGPMPPWRPDRSVATRRRPTDLQLRAEILSYSRARGLFAGVTINGSTVRSDRDANERFYGKRSRRDRSCYRERPTRALRCRSGSRRWNRYARP